MRERPILFRDDMVRAILAGTKTQTRRLLNMKRSGFDAFDRLAPVPDDFRPHQLPGDARVWRHTGVGMSTSRAFTCPFGSVGDRLWVRECFSACRHGAKHPDCLEYPPHLERLLALSLARVEELENERTAMNMRMLELETQRNVAEDERDAAIARAQSATHTVSSNLRHESMQASVELLDFAHSLKAAGRPVKAAAAESRSRKIVEALRT